MPECRTRSAWRSHEESRRRRKDPPDAVEIHRGHLLSESLVVHPREKRRRGPPRCSCLELLERSRPILLEQAGHGAVGQKTPIRLTPRAVVRLIGGISDAL